MTSALILLSTYNGEKFLAEQLESILWQTFTDWNLLIRDDGSNAETLAIISRYTQLDPRIILLSDKEGNVNVKKSFSILMAAALQRNEDFIFFCDQDDVWLPEKLAQQVELLKTSQDFPEQPVLVHSDLCVVDSHLKVLHPSFLAFEKLNRNEAFPLKTLLVNNYVTGCAMGMNRALLKIAFPIPEAVFMHDWWCALCAAAVGKIVFLDKKTILYRQHAANQIGSKSFYAKFSELLSFKKSFLKRKKNLQRCLLQANLLLSRLPPHHPHFEYVRHFAELNKLNFWQRYSRANQLGIKPANIFKATLFWMMLMTVGSETT